MLADLPRPSSKTSPPKLFARVCLAPPLERPRAAFREDGLVVPVSQRRQVGAGVDLLLLLGAERELPERAHAAQGSGCLDPPALPHALLQTQVLAEPNSRSLPRGR